MKCGFCGNSTAPLGMSWNVSGQKVVVLQCSSCQAVLGATNDDADLVNRMHDLSGQLMNLEDEVQRLRRG